MSAVVDAILGITICSFLVFIMLALGFVLVAFGLCIFNDMLDWEWVKKK